MRLICPNCGAQYEVPTEVIPENGRDVQCSSCQHTWFQPHPDAAPAPIEEELTPEPMPEHAPEPEPEPEPMPEPAPAAEPEPMAETPPEPEPDPEVPPVRKPLPPEVADVFREEREFENRRRAVQSGSLETQPDLGLEEPETGRRERLAAMRDDEEPTYASPAARAAASRGDLLPDVEEINQTLRSDTQPRTIDTAERRILDDDDYDESQGGGFARGFFVMVMLFAIGGVVYAMAPSLSEAMPQLAEPLASYTGTIDAGRVWLNDQVGGMLMMLDGMSSEANAPEQG